MNYHTPDDGRVLPSGQTPQYFSVPNKSNSKKNQRAKAFLFSILSLEWWLLEVLLLLILELKALLTNPTSREHILKPEAKEGSASEKSICKVHHCYQVIVRGYQIAQLDGNRIASYKT